MVSALCGGSEGFEIHEAEVIYWGRCPECSTKP
jgi:Fe2+ or Zn2+ uptake regulation protein